jgi:hypothetical protein
MKSRQDDCPARNDDAPGKEPLPPLFYGDRNSDARLQHGKTRVRYTPFIYLDHDDPQAPTGVFWLSPDIWVESSLGINLPRQGEPNRVFARVHNAGLMDAANVNVRFYWADPSAAITDTAVHPIGGSAAAATRAGVHLPAAASPGLDRVIVVECPTPWYPASVAHACLVVKAWCPGADPPAPPFEPALDAVNSRHCAQRNVNVQLLPPGAGFQLAVTLANPTRFALEVSAQVRLLGTGRLHAALKSMRIRVPQRIQPLSASVPMTARWSDAPTRLQPEDDGALARWLAATAQDDGATRCEAWPGGRTVTELKDRFAPGERRLLDLRGEVPADAPPGAAFGVEVVQRLGDLVVGGYTLLAVVQAGADAKGYRPL